NDFLVAVVVHHDSFPRLRACMGAPRVGLLRFDAARLEGVRSGLAEPRFTPLEAGSAAAGASRRAASSASSSRSASSQSSSSLPGANPRASARKNAATAVRRQRASASLSSRLAGSDSVIVAASVLERALRLLGACFEVIGSPLHA